MAFAGITLRVKEITVDSIDRLEITVDPWLREVVQGEEIVWSLDDPGGIVTDWKIVEKDVGSQNPAGKKRRGLPNPRAQAPVWLTDPLELPSLHPGPNDPIQDGDLEDYNIEVNVTDSSGAQHLITLDPDYRVRP